MRSSKVGGLPLAPVVVSGSRGKGRPDAWRVHGEGDGASRRPWIVFSYEKQKSFSPWAGWSTVMLRYGFGFLVVGFAAAFFGFAGIASASLGVARVLFLVCLVGFIATMAFVASESDRVSH